MSAFVLTLPATDLAAGQAVLAAMPSPVAAAGTVDAGERGPVAVGSKIRDHQVQVKDVDGIVRRPLSADKAKLAVIFFVSHDCPISNSYAPEINRICQTFGGEVAFTIVHPYEELPAVEAKKHGQDFGFQVPIVVDTDRSVTRPVGVSITPEAAVIAADGKLLYRGRIDDLWSDFGTRRPEPTKHDLRVAIRTALDGKPVPQPGGEAIGCPIE